MDDEIQKKWTVLVAGNVPGVDPQDIHRIVSILMKEIAEGLEPNFWHAASTVQNRISECGCSLCIKERFKLAGSK